MIGYLSRMQEDGDATTDMIESGNWLITHALGIDRAIPEQTLDVNTATVEYSGET